MWWMMIWIGMEERWTSPCVREWGRGRGSGRWHAKLLFFFYTCKLPRVTQVLVRQTWDAVWSAAPRLFALVKKKRRAWTSSLTCCHVSFSWLILCEFLQLSITFFFHSSVFSVSWLSLLKNVLEFSQRCERTRIFIDVLVSRQRVDTCPSARSFRNWEL